MQSIFDTTDRDSLLARIAQLQPGNTRLWGTMSPAQMLAHCANVLKTGAGVRPMKQKFLGRLSGEEWGRLMYKHIDHHLRQSGVW